MAEKQPRKGLLGALDKAYAFVDGVRGLIMILSALSVGGASGTLLASDKDTAARVDSLEIRVDSLEGSVGQMRAEQRAAFGALMDAIPAFKEAVKARGEANTEARQKKAESDQLIENLTGGTP